MTDNRTTELREKLTERGIEFTTDDFNHLLTTNWWVDEIYAKYLEGTSKSYADEDDPVLKLRIKRVTPEQAIAATLGEQRSTAEITELLDEFEHECYMLRVEASETRARDDVVRKSYERIRDEFTERIAATLGSEREKALEELVQYALDEGHIDEWWYEDALKLGLEARY